MKTDRTGKLNINKELDFSVFLFHLFYYKWMSLLSSGRVLPELLPCFLSASRACEAALQLSFPCTLPEALSYHPVSCSTHLMCTICCTISQWPLITPTEDQLSGAHSILMTTSSVTLLCPCYKQDWKLQISLCTSLL